MFKFIRNTIYFVLWIIVYFLAFYAESETINALCVVIGFWGVLYVLYFLGLLFFCPIKRDLMLVSGKFLKTVITLVLFIPFVFSFGFILRDKVCGCTESSYDKASNLLIGGDTEIEDTNDESHVFWTVYYHFVDPGNQHMSVSKNGRTSAALIAILGIILLNGLLISTLINWFDNRKSLWANGEIVYGGLAFACRKNNAVVIGVDDNAPVIIRNLLDGKGECKNLDYIIVLTNSDVISVRSQIYSYLPNYLQRKVIIYRGQLDALEQISKLPLKKAKEIYVLGEKQIEDDARSFHDIQNIKIVHNIASYLTDKCVERKIVCHVLFEYQTTFSVFQFSDLPSKITDHLVFIPFNNYESWAQCVLVKGSYSEPVTKVLPMQRRLDFQPTRLNNILYSAINSLSGWMKKNNIEPRTFNYLPLEGTGGFSIKSEKYVHFVVVGMSKMGIAMALQAAQIAHYPNFKPQNGRRTRISFIDLNADTEKDFFIGRFQNMFNLARHRYLDLSNSSDLNVEWTDPICSTGSKCGYYDACCNKEKIEENCYDGNFIDIEWEFIKGNLEKESVKSYLRAIAGEAEKNEKVLTIAICRPLAHEAIAAALYMPDEVYQFAQQIWVYQREASDMIANITNKNNADRYYDKIRPFGMSDADFTTDKECYYRAQLANYVYDFDATIAKEKINVVIDKIGDASDKCKMSVPRAKWKELTMFHRWSNKYLANSFETKLRSLGGYTTSNVEINLDVLSAKMDENKAAMAECEHNRWNMQQLLMGFRAYTDGELRQYLAIVCENKDEQKAKRKKYKKDKQNGKDRAHLDICSYAKLKEIDAGVMEYDEKLNAAVPYILKITEEARKSANNQNIC